MRTVRSGTVSAGLALVVAMGLTACNGGGNTAPRIVSFTATSVTSGVAYRWSVTDPDGDPLGCSLDVDGDGAANVEVQDCAATTTFRYLFATPGRYTSELTLDDGHGNAVSATVPAIAGGTSATPPTWAAQLGTSGADYATGVTVDASGNATVLGYTSGTFPGNTDNGTRNLLLAKYGSDGQRRWLREFGTNGNDVSSGITADAAGNTIVTASTTGHLPGYTNAGGNDILLAEYRPDGSQLWAIQFGTSVSDDANAIASDAGGDTIVAGDTFGAVTGFVNAGGGDILVAKYDPEGNQLWAVQYGGTGNETALGAATDASGNIFVAGYTDGALPNKVSAGNRDIVVLKYDPDGHLVWAEQLGTGLLDEATGIVSDADGNAILTGYTGGAFPGYANAGYNDVIVAKYDAGGIPLWLREFGGSFDDTGTAITIDAGGNTTLTGTTAHWLPGHTGAGESDVILAKYDPDGTQLWTRQFGTDNFDFGTGIASDPDGNTVLAGYTRDGALPGYTNAGSFDVILAKYLP